MIEPTDFILCGMPSEVSVLNASFPANPVHGGTAKGNLASLVPPSCKRIISMGLGGGLSPRIKIATGAVATVVTDGAGNDFACDSTWNDMVSDVASAAIRDLDAPWARGFLQCRWYSSGIMDEADTAPQRADLLAKTWAWGIDDETHAAALFCKERGLALNVLRFCSDDYSETLPLAARGAIMNADGSANIEYLLQELASEGIIQDADLFKIAADFNSSLAALQQATQAIAGV